MNSTPAKNRQAKDLFRSFSLGATALLVGLLLTAAVFANGPLTTESEDSLIVLDGPPSGTAGDEGLSALDPWTVIDPAPFAVSRPAGAFWNGRFYIIGGEEAGGGFNGRVQAYDVATASWNGAAANPMPTPLSNLCAATIGGRIFVPGGWTGTATVATLQILDTATGTWTVAASDPLPAARLGAACTAHNGRLYVFGGWDDTAATATAWVYDPQLPAGTRWSVLADSTFSHAYASAVRASNGLIFVTGASNNQSANFDNVGAYNPVTNTWTDYPPLSTPRGGAAVWTVGQRLYVGGGGWSSFLSSVESYDLTQGSTGTWQAAPSLNQGRRTAAAATDPATGRLYIGAGFAAGFLNSAETSRAPNPAFFASSLKPNSPTFFNPNGQGAMAGGAGGHHYCVIQLTVDRSGSYTIEMASPNTAGTPSNALDTFLRLHEGSFNPDNPAGAIAFNDDYIGPLTVLPGLFAGVIGATGTGAAGALPASRLASVNLAANTTYFLVQTSWRRSTAPLSPTIAQAVGPFYTGVAGVGSPSLVGNCGDTSNEVFADRFQLGN